MSTVPRSPSGLPRRSPAPWLYALAAALTVLAPILFVLVWAVDGTLGGFVPALVAALADLAAAVLAAVAATVIAAQRGIVRVRTAVTGHPEGRVGRLAEYHAARWHLARDRFAALRSEWAAFEADRGAVARRPALTDVSVPATARFVEAYGDAEFLLTDAAPGGPRRGEFVEAVDRAVAAWDEARRVADELAGEADAVTGASDPYADTRAVPGAPPAVEPPHGPRGGVGRVVPPEYTEAADAVRRAARRGVHDLRGRLRA